MHRNSNLAGGTSNSRQASIISSPLFSIVAESMVIRRPITHVGCFSACSGVMPAKSASGVFRNGPPEAVSQMVFTSACRADPHALVHGVVLTVDRENRHIAFARRGGQNFARRDHALFVGQAHRLSRQDRRMRGLKPCDPDNGRNHEIGFGMRGAGDRPFRSVDDLDPADSRLLEPRSQLDRKFLGC